MTVHRQMVSPAARRLLTIFGLCAAVAFTPAVAAADEIDDYVEAQRRWLRIPGLSLAVVKDGAVVKARGYGLANVEHEIPAGADTVYKIGSLSKQFVAAAALVLAQDGKLGLDDPVGKHLNDLPRAWHGITVRHLLTHTSGLTREFPAFDPFRAKTDAETLREAAPLPLRSAPGEKWGYSNVGYYLLAEVVRAASGRPWDEFVRDRVFAPAKMASTRAATADVVKGRAGGYSARGRRLEHAPTWAVVRPSGGFMTTVTDLAKWDAALESDAVLTKDSREQMWTPVRLKGGSTHPYGFGWFVDSAHGHPRVRHDGGVPGLTAEYQRFTADRTTVIVLANADNRDLGDVALRVAGFNTPSLRPPPEKFIDDRDAAVTDRVKAVLAGLANGTVEARLFTDKLGRALKGDAESGFGDGLRGLGPLRSIGLLERKPDGDGTTFRYRVHYAHVPLFVQCATDRTGVFVTFRVHD